MKAKPLIIFVVIVLVLVVLFCGVAYIVNSTVQSQIDNSVIRSTEVSLDELPKGTRKVTYLGRGWFTFELSVNGMTRRFLGLKYTTSHYYSEIQFTELKD